MYLGLLAFIWGVKVVNSYDSLDCVALANTCPFADLVCTRSTVCLVGVGLINRALLTAFFVLLNYLYLVERCWSVCCFQLQMLSSAKKLEQNLSITSTGLDCLYDQFDIQPLFR